MSEGDLSERLNQVLSDPARLAQIAALAKSFTGDGAPPPASPEKSDPGCEKLPPAAGFLPPELLRDWKEHAGERVALLRAMRPFLEPERRAKVDRVLSLLRTLDLLAAMQK